MTHLSFVLFVRERRRERGTCRDSESVIYYVHRIVSKSSVFWNRLFVALAFRANELRKRKAMIVLPVRRCASNEGAT